MCPFVSSLKIVFPKPWYTFRNKIIFMFYEFVYERFYKHTEIAFSCVLLVN